MAAGPYLIGIAGATCSGKSLLAERLAQALSATVLTLDSYYRDLTPLPMEERDRRNFDDPEAIDKDLLVEQLQTLAQGREIQKPVYRFDSHTRAAHRERVEPGRTVIVEGLFTLYWEEVRRLLQTKVFLAVEDPVCVARRLDRDIRERGRTRESVLQQYEGTVRPMYERYVLPTRQHADLVLSGEEPVESLVTAVRAHVTGRSNSPRPGAKR